MKIKMLNNETINKIAAGEVIIRPVSVVKELVENAIDAGADQIEVILEAGGKNRMTVRDNGCGIAYNEIPLAFKRHATSKINTIDDLETILSLGFRGEALSSVSAVAKVQITTRYEGEEMGSRTLFEGGKLISQRVCAYNCGTEITVVDLFFNTPARRKHLEKDKKEEILVRELLEKLALSHPLIRFQLIRNGQTVLSTPGTGKLLDVVKVIYGVDVADNLIALHYENTPMKIKGFLGNLKTFRSHREDQIFFINERYVKNQRLSQALDEAYEGYAMKHQHPMGIIFMELPGRMLDVNIHPAKTEIKILNESLVSLLFKQGIRETLRGANLTMNLGSGDTWLEADGENAAQKQDLWKKEREAVSEFNNDSQIEWDTVVKQIPERKFAEKVDKDFVSDQVVEERGSEAEKEEPNQREKQPAESFKNLVEETIADFEKQKPVYASVRDEKIESQNELPVLREEKPLRPKTTDLSQMKIVGQLFNVYILLEGEKEIYLLDQHAAHEAFLSQELQQIFNRRESLASQVLMTPIPIKIRPRDVDRIEMALMDYKKMGFDCDVFGSDTLLVRSVPVLMGEPQNTELLQAMIDENLFNREDDSGSASVFSEKLKNRLIAMACKAAIKGGQALTRDEIRKLLENLMELDNPYTCPHGRPIILRLKEYELMKLFKRVV